ncbi:MAG: hypothetical protein ACM3VT_13830 [Solirubrobacterales bacterium]
MKRLMGIAFVCVSAMAWSSSAQADPTTVTFTALPDTPFSIYTEGLVTFTGVEGKLLMKDSTPDDAYALRSVDSPYQQMRADISGGASFISVDLGDFPYVDSETIFLRVFNAQGGQLGYTDLAIPADLQHMTTLSLSSDECIAYAIFGSFGSSNNNGSSVRADNFTFESCVCPSVVPAPGAILLAAMGAGLVGHLRRRKTL